MDSHRYAAYRRACELLEGPDAQRLSAQERELIRDHAEEALLRRGPGLADEVDEISQSAAFLLKHLTAVGVLPRRLAAEIENAVFACAPSGVTRPKTRSPSSVRPSPLPENGLHRD